MTFGTTEEPSDATANGRRETFTRTDRPKPGWTQEALSRWAQLKGRVAHLDPVHQQVVEENLTRARTLLETPMPSKLRWRLANWWNGDYIEQTWAWLEQAEIDLVEYSDQEGTDIALVIALLRADKALSTTDPRRVALETLAEDKRRAERGVKE